MANEVTASKTTELAAHSEQFTEKVLREFGQVSPGEFRVSDYQRQLVAGYFIQIDKALKAADEKRISDNSWMTKKNNDPITWNTIDLTALALDVMHYARMGLDMTQKNTLFAIPYKDNNRKCKGGTAMYVVNLMQGYNGIQYIAEMYALEKPKSVTVELVYSADTFSPIKKGMGNDVEQYQFTINNPFDRGDVVGGFGYIEYADPTKNRLIIMSKKDIEKRIPKKTSANFWGTTATGKKVTEWVDGKKTQVDTEGWYEEMCLKTIKREVYSPKNIPIDPRKVDESYQHMRAQEIRFAQINAQNAAYEQTASVALDIPAAPPLVALPEPQERMMVDEITGEIFEAPKEPVPIPNADTAEPPLEGQMAINPPF